MQNIFVWERENRKRKEEKTEERERKETGRNREV